MKPTQITMGLVLLAALAGTAWFVFVRRPPTPELPSGLAPQSRPASQAESLPASAPMAASDEDGLPPEALKKYPPNSFIALRLPTNLKKGVKLPDGSYLPLLNGVKFAQPVQRSTWDGPITPVVGKITDQEGIEYWVHADGSTTTTRFMETTGPDGKPFQNTATIHAAKVADKQGVPMPEPNVPPGKLPPPKGAPGTGPQK